MVPVWLAGWFCGIMIGGGDSVLVLCQQWWRDLHELILVILIIYGRLNHHLEK